MPRFTARLVGAVFLWLLGSALFPADPAHAYTAGSPPLDHQPPGYYNTAEQNAWWLCNYAPGTQYSARGAVWFTSESSYYSLGVNAADGQTSVPVYIRGSVYSCSNDLLNVTVYATNIAPQGAQGWRLSGLSSTSLNRGTFLSSGERRWTSQGNSVSATLDVSGLATNNSTSTATETIDIDLYRCYSTDGVKSVNCYAETVPIVVTRTPPVATYTNSATSEMYINGGATPAANNSTVTVGDTVTWSYKLTTTQNSGPFKNRTVDYTFSCLVDSNSWSDNPASSSYTFTSPGTQAIADSTGPDCKSPFKAKSSDVGKTICHRLEYYPKTQEGEVSYVDSQVGATGYLCVKVVAGIVTPKLAMVPDGVRIPDGSDLKFVFGATNVSNPATTIDICYRARIWYEKSPIANTTYNVGVDSLYFKKASIGCGGSDEYTAVLANTTADQIFSDVRAVDITKGGKVCAEWYIESVTYGIGTGSPNPVRQCIIVGKTPTFQVWGNELRNGIDGAEVDALTTTLTKEPLPTTSLILNNTTLTRGSTCVPWASGDAGAIFGAAGSVAKLKSAYGQPVPVLSSSKDSPRLQVRYLKPSVFDSTGAIPSYGNYDPASCLESSGSGYIADDYNHLQPTKGELWYSIANEAFVSGDSKSKIRTYTTSPRNELASYRTNFGAAPWAANIWAPFFSNLVAPYDPTYIARPTKLPYKDYFDYQLWAVGEKETSDQGLQIYQVMHNRSAGAVAFRHSFDIDYNAIKVTDPANQQTTGLILFAMVADDFSAAYINGHRLSNDVLGMTRGDVVSKGGRFVAVAVDKTWFNVPGPDGVSKDNVLTVIDFDKYQTTDPPSISDVGVGVMYSMLYFPPKASLPTSATTGSWTEYGVLAPSLIKNVASGSGLALGHNSSDQASWSRLTFANSAAPYGNFASATAMGTIPNIAGYFAGVTMPGQKINRAGAVTISNTSSDKPADLTQPGGRVLIASGKVTIADNIVASAAAKVDDMRQVVIIAPDIEIAGNVTQVDAWLIATNSINTCSDVAVSAPLSSSICNRPLKVNGALTGTTVYLRRTSGNDKDTRREAAEILDLRGDAFIWARGVSEKNGTWTTRSVTELPPRY